MRDALAFTPDLMSIVTTALNDPAAVTDWNEFTSRATAMAASPAFQGLKPDVEKVSTALLRFFEERESLTPGAVDSERATRAFAAYLLKNGKADLFLQLIQEKP